MTATLKSTCCGRRNQCRIRGRSTCRARKRSISFNSKYRDATWRRGRSIHTWRHALEHDADAVGTGDVGPAVVDDAQPVARRRDDPVGHATEPTERRRRRQAAVEHLDVCLVARVLVEQRYRHQRQLLAHARTHNATLDSRPRPSPLISVCTLRTSPSSSSSSS